jgi:transglutaminase-like putative cysteine protease
VARYAANEGGTKAVVDGITKMDGTRKYLAISEYIDWDHPAIVAKAAELAGHSAEEVDIAKRCFEFVRDDIQHSLDFRRNPVACKASDVLLHGTGYCYAKSHLLAALLRANGIPAGLCYQRLVLVPGEPRHSLHGLNAVHLNGHGWYRIDPRGNKAGVQAEFAPPVERLAFPVIGPGEADLPEIWPEPLSAVIRALTENATFDQVFHNLPDIDVRDSRGVDRQSPSPSPST